MFMHHSKAFRLMLTQSCSLCLMKVSMLRCVLISRIATAAKACCTRLSAAAAAVSMAAAASIVAFRGGWCTAQLLMGAYACCCAQCCSWSIIMAAWTWSTACCVYRLSTPKVITTAAPGKMHAGCSASLAAASLLSSVRLHFSQAACTRITYYCLNSLCFLCCSGTLLCFELVHH